MFLGSNLDRFGNFKIFRFSRLVAKFLNREIALNTDPEWSVESRNCFKMWLVLMRGHKNAFGIEFGLFWQFYNFSIFEARSLNSEPGWSAFWPKLEVLPSWWAWKNLMKHRLWWYKCAGDRKIEPRTSFWPPQSPHPTIGFFRVLEKSLNRRCPVFLSLEAIFETFPVSETILTFTIRSGSIFCIGYAPNIYSWVSKKSFATKRKKNVIYYVISCKIIHICPPISANGLYRVHFKRWGYTSVHWVAT